MAKEDIIKHQYTKNAQKAHENGRKGGIASGIARRKKRTLKELSNLILDNQIQDERTIAGLKSKFPELEIDDVTFGLVLLLKQYERAKDGDPKAFEILRDTSGQSPVQKQEIDMQNLQNVTIRLEGDNEDE